MKDTLSEPDEIKAIISAELQEQISNLKDDISKILLTKENSREESMAKRSAKEIATLSIYLIERESELNKLKSEINQLREERDNLQNAVNSLLSSTSWKLTAPLRKLVRLLQRR